jgi:hypothetical protein
VQFVSTNALYGKKIDVEEEMLESHLSHRLSVSVYPVLKTVHKDSLVQGQL